MPDSPRTRELRSIKLFVFEIAKGNTVQEQFYMTLLPETYALDQPGRVTVTQTRGGFWIDNFGLGIGSLAFSGTTGWTQRPNFNKGVRSASDLVDGFERWQQLRQFFQDFFDKQERDPSGQYFMRLYNWADEDYFLVVPVGLPRLQRNVQQALLYRYEITFHVLARLEKTGYQEDKDILDEINSRTKRAVVIGQRLETKLDDQWKVLVEDILNRTTLDDGITNEELEEQGLRETVRDQQLQDFYDTILARNSAPDYVPPTDSPDGVVKRTRTLAEKIADFANGKTAFIETTLTEARAITSGWRDVLDALDYALHIPRTIAREVRETLCGVQALLLYPQIFRSSVLGTVEELNALFEESGCSTTLSV